MLFVAIDPIINLRFYQWVILSDNNIILLILAVSLNSLLANARLWLSRDNGTRYLESKDVIVYSDNGTVQVTLMEWSKNDLQVHLVGKYDQVKWLYLLSYRVSGSTMSWLFKWEYWTIQVWELFPILSFVRMPAKTISSN